MNKESGFSLTEILISLFLASVLISSLFRFYLSSKEQYRKIQKTVADQLELQWVSDLLADSVRRAGFTPCLGIDLIPNKEKRIKSLIIEQAPQEQLQINRMSEFFAEVLQFRGTKQVLIKPSVQINTKKPIMLADCLHAEITHAVHQRKLASGTLLTLAAPVHYTYNKPTYVGQWLEEKWFIHNNAQTPPSLYYHLGQTEELSPLIHSIKIDKKTNQNKTLLAIQLGLDDNKTHVVHVAVRT